MLNVHGINTSSVEMLSSEILDLADKAISKLYDIEALVVGSENYFKGDYAKILKNNIISYAEELNRLTAGYKSQSEEMDLTIKKDTGSKSIENI